MLRANLKLEKSTAMKRIYQISSRCSHRLQIIQLSCCSLHSNIFEVPAAWSNDSLGVHCYPLSEPGSNTPGGSGVFTGAAWISFPRGEPEKWHCAFKTAKLSCWRLPSQPCIRSLWWLSLCLCWKRIDPTTVKLVWLKEAYQEAAELFLSMSIYIYILHLCPLYIYIYI